MCMDVWDGVWDVWGGKCGMCMVVLVCGVCGVVGGMRCGIFRVVSVG